MNPLELLAAAAARGAVARCEIDERGGAVLVVAPRSKVADLLPEMAHSKPALVALLELQAHAETRRRREHWLCPDARLFELHRIAERETGLRLRFDGRGVSQRARNRAETAIPGAFVDETIQCIDSLPRAA